MSIKLAFSNIACPDWTIDKIASEASGMGYQGIELRTFGAGSGALTSDPALGNPAKIASTLKDAGLEPVCLSTSVALHHKRAGEAKRAAQEACDSLELAAELGCGKVRLFGNRMRPGQNRESALQTIATRVVPLIERATELGVEILFENAGSFNRAKLWWWLTNLVDHPMLGICWNVASAAAAGEPPSVSVPCLNHRIHLAKVKDAQLGEGLGFVQIGDGTVQVAQFVKRLLGIGYNGYISVEWDRLWLPGLAPAEEALPEAAKRVRAWLDEAAAPAKGFSDSEPMNKELKKLLDEAKKKKGAPAVAAAE
jgi:sugar phosphate isomerase/epimerase